MNPRPTEYSFQRYLASKRTVDDRALNHPVWESLHAQLQARSHTKKPLTILEIGGGIGTMVERLLEDGRLPSARYHLLDEQAENIEEARRRLAKHGASLLSHPTLSFSVPPTHSYTLPQPSGETLEVHLYTGDLFHFLESAGSLADVDLLLAHAFMDLVDIPATLPLFTATLRPGALLYFTINFDGATILEPTIDAAFDAHVEQVYHRTMDERVTNGKLSGDSRSGRHLFHNMKTAGINTLNAGSSDWVVMPHQGKYPDDEGYFLHFIVNTMYGALRNHPDLNPNRFQEWIAKRHTQIEQGELVYIAHQLDYLAQV